MTTLRLAPAYGRKYQTAEKAIAAFESDKDFTTSVPGSNYLNKSDILHSLPQVKTVILKLATGSVSHKIS